MNTKDSKLLSSIWEDKEFKNGKRRFYFRNFGEFKIVDKEQFQKFISYNNLQKNEISLIPFATNPNEECDQCYIACLGFTSKNKFIGVYLYNPSTGLDYPIKICNNLSDFFGEINICELLQYDLDSYSTNLYESHEIQEKNYPGVFQDKDLRIAFKEKASDNYLSSDQTFNKNDLINFFADDAKYINVSFFNTFPHQGDYNKLVNEINAKVGFKKYFYCLFHPSCFHGISKTKALDEDLIFYFIRNGFFYDFKQIDLSIIESANQRVGNKGNLFQSLFSRK